MVRSGVWLVGATLVTTLAACESAPTGVAPAESVDLATPWTVTDPAVVGVDENRLFLAGRTAEGIDRLQNLLIVRRGRVVYDRYYGEMERDSLADGRSITKSVLATLVGIAIESGAIDDIDDPITQYLRGPRFRVRVEHRAVTVRRLLQMTSGIEWSETNGPDYGVWIQSPDHENAVLDRAVVDPGSTFRYNSGAVHLLGVLLQEAVGRPLPEYADEVLFAPLGIRDVRWEGLGGDYVNGGSGIDLRPRDLARIGQLYLQDGFSGNRRLLPEGWATEATLPHRDDLGSYGPIERLGYGYLWWTDLTRGAYLAWGWGGQFVYVVPAEDLVVVATTRWSGLSGSASRQLATEVLSLITGPVLGALD